jgi:hypothetical protein
MNEYEERKKRIVLRWLQKAESDIQVASVLLLMELDYFQIKLREIKKKMDEGFRVKNGTNIRRKIMREYSTKTNQA